MNDPPAAESSGAIFKFAEVAACLPLPPTAKWPQGYCDVEVLDLGPVSVSLFAPFPVDYQTPHDLDEVYVIVAGSANLHLEGHAPRRVGTGELILVRAGAGHRFTGITPGFAAWVMFFDASAAITARG